MEANNQILPFPVFESMVRANIRQNWLELIESTNLLNRKLENALLAVYNRYQPQENGVWNASPCWTDMFKWTTCPLKGIKAVILLKSPKPIDSNSDFESTGFGAGVKRKDGNDMDQSIENIGTVNALMKIGLQCMEDPDDDLANRLARNYQGGFNPGRLSRRGILFLNVALTRGQSTDYNNTDVNMWEDFILELLATIPAENTPLFQWYLTKAIDYSLNELAELGKYVLSKPNILSFEGGHQHICYLSERQIMDYGMELWENEYDEHKQILADIFQSMVCQSNVQTY